MTSRVDPRPVLIRACAQAGLSADNAEPIRLGENAIFRLPGAVVVRVSRPGQQEAARREVAVSRWLNASGVTAVGVLESIEQPLEIDGQSVTFCFARPVRGTARSAPPVRPPGRPHRGRGDRPCR